MSEAKKFDQGKPELSLVPVDAIYEMCAAFGHGQNKYGAFNYKGGLEVRRLIDAAFRHLLAFNAGEDLDPESGKSHLGHAMASVAMAIDVMKNKPELDNRYKKE